MLTEIDLTNIKDSITKNPFFIGVVGMSASGKSYITHHICKFLRAYKISCTVLEVDNYYHNKEFVKTKLGKNYDVPEALDLKLLESHLKHLKEKEAIRRPIYDFETAYRSGYILLHPADVIVVDSLFCFLNPIAKYVDYTVYVNANPDVCFERRKERDVEIRKIPLEKVEWRWYNQVLPGYEKYILPNINNANMILDN